MDQRRQLHTGEPVQVTVLVEHESGSSGTIAKSANENVELLVDKPAPVGAAIKLEGADSLFLGEIYSCRNEGERFALGVEIQHALYNTAELARLAKRLLEEDKRGL
jgi:hypothetical protein